MEFEVSLIKVRPNQKVGVTKWLLENATYIDNHHWIYEGEEFCLDEVGIKYKVIAHGVVPCLGDKPPGELIGICDECFGVDVRDGN